ncbi:GNAT family N-acetyltransferase [Streptomyces sp. AK08-02]|uniref:GNAT family N-acetyltransferase n=1 Tax=Streptomyces sp. AK08-02 TaxID=3028654 RepID=UPI0029AA63E3|nr:GNAT family N-acetyltransferase [Streptomyces sp. AK08-02]MDX3746521.1 GNAT family N-acetyltransferase [Streptomyces sp. AK08-02]
MSTRVLVLKGDALLAHCSALHSVYVDAFCAPPWNEDEEKAVEFVGRLPVNVRRPDFTAALAFAGPEIIGFATAWTTRPPTPPPTARASSSSSAPGTRPGLWPPSRCDRPEPCCRSARPDMVRVRRAGGGEVALCPRTAPPGPRAAAVRLDRRRRGP